MQADDRKTEARVKLRVRNYLKSLGDRCWFFMPVSNGMGVIGIPDFICCIDGKFVAIETKAPGKRWNVTEHQRRQLDAINRANGVAYVTDNGDDIPVLVKVAL